MDSFIETFVEHIKGLPSDDLAKLAGEVFQFEPTLKTVGEDTIFTFSSPDYDSDWNFHDAENVFRKVALARMPSNKMSKIQSLFEAARTGTLPEGFSDWEICDPVGRTVAHEAALYGHLPADFGRWEVRDREGWSVAHNAAMEGHLPKGFDQWELSDEDGNSVAHEAARIGGLPADFDNWALHNDNFFAVAHMAAIHGHLPKGFDQWDIRDDWDVRGKAGNTVAQYAAEAGNLPADFDRWDLVDEEFRPDGWEEKTVTPKMGM